MDNFLKSKELVSKSSSCIFSILKSVPIHIQNDYLIPEYHTSCIKWINFSSRFKHTVFQPNSLTSLVQMIVTSSSSSSSSTSRIPESCSDLGLVLSISVSKIVYASFLDFLLLPILGCCKTMLSRFLCCWAQD